MPGALTVSGGVQATATHDAVPLSWPQAPAVLSPRKRLASRATSASRAGRLLHRAMPGKARKMQGQQKAAAEEPKQGQMWRAIGIRGAIEIPEGGDALRRLQRTPEASPI